VPAQEDWVFDLLEKEPDAVENFPAPIGEFGLARLEEHPIVDGENLDKAVGQEIEVLVEVLPEPFLEKLQVLDLVEGSRLHGILRFRGGADIVALLPDAEGADDGAHDDEPALLVDHRHAHQEDEEGEHEGHHVREGDEPGGPTPRRFLLLLPGHLRLRLSSCCSCSWAAGSWTVFRL